MLSPITTKVPRHDFAVYDLEWIPGTLQLRLCGLYDGSRWMGFTTANDFLNEVLTDDYAGKWLFAHAGGLADINFLLERLLTDEELTIEAAFSGSSAIIVNVRRGEQSWTFCDSYWLLRDKLEKIGNAVGLKKTGGDYLCRNFPYCGHISREGARLRDQLPYEEWKGISKEFAHCVFYAPMGELRDYNQRDCMILYKGISDFQELIIESGGELKKTIASTAMALFRRRYLGEKIPTSPDINEIAREAYVASRVEVFQDRCDQDAFYYDINSSFPFSMTKPCPGRVVKRGKKWTPERGIALVDATVSVPPMYLPPLPYRHKERVFFPTGSWRSWFNHVDLELLEEAGGRIEKVHEAVHFASQSFLRDYAEDIYEKRRSAKDDFYKLVLKYLLNSLYGKFGERPEKTGLIVRPTTMGCPHNPRHACVTYPACEHGAQGIGCCMEMLFPGAMLITSERPLPHEWVPISVEITANSRASLYRFLHGAQANVYYSDTDSLITTAILPTGDKLGDLKLEANIVGGEFLQPKLYAYEKVAWKPSDSFDDGFLSPESKMEVRSKGFSRMTYEKFTAIRQGQHIEIERMMRVREMLRKGLMKPEESIYLKRANLNGQMAKRCSLPDGHTRPWSLEEIERQVMYFDGAV